MTSREQMPETAIIVPSWNTRELLALCLDSIAATAGDLQVETIVVDNGSTDGSDTLVRDRFPSVRLIANRDNAGFARAANQGIAASRAPFVLLLNSDARLLPDALEPLLGLARRQPRAAIIGVQVLNADGSFQASHARFPKLRQELLILSGIGRLLLGRSYPSYGPDEARGPRPVDWVSGACFLARRAALVEVGLLDEGYFMYSEELDLCYRVRCGGWQVWYQPASRVVHVGSASSRDSAGAREADLYCSRVRFFRKHYGQRAAAPLVAAIYICTAVKQAVHALLRHLSNGRWGRSVMPIGSLTTRLRARR